MTTSRTIIGLPLLAAALCLPLATGCDVSNKDDTPDSGAGTDAGSGTEHEFHACMNPCAEAADCVPAGSTAITDADNYECGSDGYCSYKGCNSNAECDQVYTELGYVCHDTGLGYSDCLAPCAGVADCVGGNEAYDADNYTCEGGACVYQGCNTDDECDSTFEGYVCVKTLFAEISFCAPSCWTASDCVLSVDSMEDEDNYVCDDGACVYVGCNSDDECQSSFTYGSGWECI